MSKQQRIVNHDASDRHVDDENKKEFGRGNTPLLICIFGFAIILLVTLFSNLPELSDEEYEQLSFPRSVQDLRSLTAFLLKYRDDHFWAVLSGFCSVYIFLQTFAIPGAIFLSILAGPLFGVAPGLCIVSLVATTGASMCYMLSYYVGRGLVARCFPDLLAKFRKQIRRNSHNLFFYLLFLRVSPLLPNWFISVSSPILDVPLVHFFFATLLGLIPANYLHVTTGLTLNELQSVHGSTLNPRALLTLCGIALLTLIPTCFRQRFREIDERIAKPHPE